MTAVSVEALVPQHPIERVVERVAYRQLVSRCEPRDDSGAAHIHMPFNAPTLLDERTIATLRAWIEAGAQDD